MKFLLAICFACTVLRPTHGQCTTTSTRVVIIQDALPAGYVAAAQNCIGNCYYYTFATYQTVSTLGLTMNDALVVVPSTASTPDNTAAIVANTAYISNLAANTNLYFLTSTTGSNPADIAANNQLIINLGVFVPTVHVVDYYVYLTVAPLPAVSAQNPCSYMAAAPLALSGACAYPVSTRVVILTDETAPYPNMATNCLSHCVFYTTAMYMGLSSLGLGKNDALILIPTATTAITTTGIVNFSAYLYNLSQATNVYVFTSNPLTNAISNAQINAIPGSFPQVQVKDYGGYTCPQILPPGISCACRFIMTNYGG